jgi:hypothetical protein
MQKVFSVGFVPRLYSEYEPSVEARSNTSTVTLGVVGRDEMGSLKSETEKYGPSHKRPGPEKDSASKGQQRIQKTEPSSRQRGRPTKTRRNCQTVIKNVVVSLKWDSTPRPTDWPSVAMWLSLSLLRTRVPCGGGVEYFHRDPASRRRRRKWKSQIWNSKILYCAGPLPDANYNLLGYRRHRSICYTRLFTTPRVVITASPYNESWPPDVLSRSGSSISSSSECWLLTYWLPVTDSKSKSKSHCDWRSVSQ